MAISTFGGIAANTNNSVSGTIGAPLLAPANFTSTSYVDTGASFSPTVYPQLAACYPAAFVGDTWKSVVSPVITAMAANTTFGTFVTAFTMGSEFYVLFSNGYVLKTTGGTLSSLAYFKQIPISNGTILFAGIAGSNFYVVYNTGFMQIFTESTLTNYSVSAIGTVATIRYGNGVWIACNTANASTYNMYYRSTDGINFTSSTFPVSQIWCGIDYGNNTWSVVSKTTGTTSALTSPDGITWTSRTGQGIACSGAVKYNSTLNLFAATIGSTTNSVYTSPDCITCTSLTAASGTTPTAIDCTTNGVFFTHVPGSNVGAMTSTDGITWTNRASVIQGITGLSNNSNLRAFGTKIVAFGNLFSSNYITYMGISSDNLATAPATQLSASGAPGNIFPPALVGTSLVTTENLPLTIQAGSPSYSYSTNNGTAWAAATLPVSNISIRGCFATPTKFIIWGISNANNAVYILSSSDGINWTTKSFAIAGVTVTSTITACNYGETLYFGSGYIFAVTPDYGNTIAISLLPTQVATTTCSYTVTTTGTIVLMTSTGTVYTSNNNGVTWIAGAWVGVASSTIGQICTGPKATICTVVAAASPAAYAMSADFGQTWQLLSFPAAISSLVKSAFYLNGYYFVYLGNNAYYYSADGINWVSMSTGLSAATTQNWSQAGVSNGSPFITGQVGTYLTGDGSSYHVPFIPSSIAGTKYVVRAQ